MIYKGRNVIVSAGDSVLAGSKSCSLDVKCDTIPISSPTDGQWENAIAGRKSWSMTTNHLVINYRDYEKVIEAYAGRHTGAGSAPSGVKVNGVSKGSNYGRGLNIIQPLTSDTVTTYDTYGTPSLCGDIVTMLGNLSNGTVVAIVSYDAYNMTDALITAIGTTFGIDASNLSKGTSGGSVVIIGEKGGGGIARSSLQTSGTHAQLYLLNNHVLTTTPMKDMVLRVGQTYKLRMQVDGYPSDYVQGQAICETAKVQATLGNLVTGSFSWRGIGSLT